MYKACGLSMIGNTGGKVTNCLGQKCMFWDSQYSTCIIRNFFLAAMEEEPRTPVKPIDNKDVA